MHSKNKPSNDGSQDDPTSQKCLEIVKNLVEPGNPKSNWFAVCIIGNCQGEVKIAVNAVNTLTPLDVAERAQQTMNELWEHANKSN